MSVALQSSQSSTLFSTWFTNFLPGQHGLVFIFTSVVCVNVTAQSWGGLIGKLLQLSFKLRKKAAVVSSLANGIE